MKNFIRIASFVLISLQSHIFADCINLSLEDVFRIIYQQNLSYINLIETTESVRQDSLISRADLFPQVSLNATQQRSKSILNSDSGITNFHASRFDADAQLNYSLLDLKKIFDYKSAKTAYSVSQLQTEFKLQEILKNTTNTFFLHQRNLRKLDVINANIARDQTLLDLAELQFNAGTASALDVTRAKVQLATDQKTLLQQQTEIRNSELKLLQLLNFSPCCQFQIHYPCDDCPSPSFFACNLNYALKTRSDFLAAEKLKDQYCFSRKSAGYDQFPKLNVTGAYGGANNYLKKNLHQEWNIGLTLSMPIFDGFKIRSNKLKADALIRSQDATIQDLKNQISTDILSNQQNLNSLFKQIAISQQQVQLGQEELDLATTRFQQGIADNSDVVTAQANLALYYDNLVESQYNYNLAKSDWASSHGDLSLLLFPEALK